MISILKEMHEPCLFQCGFYRVEHAPGYNSAGVCYAVPPEKGEGYYWVYAKDNLFSVSIHDFVLREDYFLEYQQPRYLSIGYYDSISGEELRPYKRLSCNCIRGHISDNDLYQAIYHKNIPVRSTGIEIMPEYYEDYLNTQYPGEFKDPRSAFSSLDGRTDFPELVFLLRQVRNFRGTGAAAKLYYEAKVAEAVSLIIEKTKRSKTASAAERISKQDLDGLASVIAYLDDHLILGIHLDQLARIACMGTTKLAYTFKAVYKCTISEYVQNKRMGQAEHLLANTDLSIRQVSQIVGYKRASSFTEIFRKNTGLLPNEYRKLSLSNMKPKGPGKTGL
jgi:AraC-like DNA-binding protein